MRRTRSGSALTLARSQALSAAVDAAFDAAFAKAQGAAQRAAAASRCIGVRWSLAVMPLLLLALTAPLAVAKVSVTVDRERVAMGETLLLTIASDADEDPSAADLAPLQRDFDILQRSNSSSMQIINGQTQRSRELRLELLPQREGTLEIPPLNVDGVRSTPLRIEVSAAAPTAGADQDVIFTAEVDSQSVYVQQQVVLTLRVEQAINLDERSVSELELAQDAFITPLGQNSFQRNSGGRRWLVNELRFAIFPQQSGTLTIPAQTFAARERRPSRSLFDLSSGPRVQRSSQPIEIEVKPRPATFPGSEWLPARQLTLEEQWSQDPEQLTVGQSLTRTVIVRAQGLQGAQLPPLLFSPQQGLKYYPDQPSIEDSESDQGVIGMRVDSAALVPVQPGRYQLPEVRIAWWDTSTDSLRYATLPARTLDVAAAAGANSPSAVAGTVAVPASGTSPDTETGAEAAAASTAEQTAQLQRIGSTLRRWQGATAVCALAWLATALLWWRSRRGAPPGSAGAAGAAMDGKPTATEKAAWQALCTACERGDAAAARTALQHWLQQRQDFQRADTLRSYAQRQEASALNEALQQLERALYGTPAAGGAQAGNAQTQAQTQARTQSQTGWNGAPLLQACKALRTTGASSAATAQPGRALAALYPSTSSS